MSRYSFPILYDREIRFHAICIVLVLAAAIRIASSWTALNHTMDEPTHIACGLQWWKDRQYTYELQHPPLSRIAVAFGPWLLGAPNVKREELHTKNPLVLYDSPDYTRTLSAARMGELPFFLLGAWVVWRWARRLHGDLAAGCSVALFTTLPPVLAHAGLATTDMAIAATLPAAVYAFLRWLNAPGYKSAIVLGLAAAAGLLSKFTFVIFFPVCLAVVLVLIRPKPHTIMRTLPIAFLAAFLTVWAAYWFRVDPFPAAGIYFGILEVRTHNAEGHLTYLMGELSDHGWWYFFPVVFAYKTPIAFMVLILLAVAFLFRAPREQRIPLACAIAMLLSVMPSQINLGVRHILPLYPMLAISAGFAAAKLASSRFVPWRVLVGALFLWQAGGSLRTHPDYIAWFNELAGGEPERIRVDSDLDWGQSIKPLAAHLRARGIDEQIAIGWFGSTMPVSHGVNARRASPWEPSTGWVALGATERFLSAEKSPDGSGRKPWSWIDRYHPAERIGGMLVYRIPPLKVSGCGIGFVW